ncbi:hypothetical protein NGRA_2178 [Nosema granulosis]|uniref:Glutaredoxin domain-containing protein n=1 Tax=Nosema granulosis TaxID=83296 RepID=A0A9P6GY05_9MICR|nr:hypothetical protein NGRA_2178 [Nosema granulosis]
MTRRIIDQMIEEKLTFVIVSPLMEDCELIEAMLYEYGYPITIYRGDLYEILRDEVIALYDYDAYPAIFVGGKFIGGTNNLYKYLSARHGPNFSGCHNMENFY